MATLDPDALPPPLELARRYRQLQGGDIDNVLRKMGEETQLLSIEIKPLRRGMRCAGLAVTWNAVLASHDPIPRQSEEVKKWRRILDCIYPGCVLVYQPGGERSSGHLGSMYANTLAACGALGAIVDGNLRDSDGHERIPNWAPFARGTSPLEAGSRIKWMEANTPILMSGELRRWIEVFPGDMVFADGDGVIIIPRRLILPVLEQAEALRAREALAEREFATAKDPREVMKRYRVG